MAGMNAPGAVGMERGGLMYVPGLGWTDKRTYANAKNSRGGLNSLLGPAGQAQAEAAQLRERGTMTSPTGEKSWVNGVDPNEDFWRRLGQGTGQTGGGSGGGGGGTQNTGQPGGSGSDGAPGGRQLLDELRRPQPTTYEAPQQPTEDGMSDGDQAYLNRSKERIGNTLRGGINALGSEMARRGISGSSRLAAGNMTRLFRGAQADNAETERGLVEGRVARNRQIADSNFAARLQALRDNQAAQSGAQGRLQSLLQYYNMLY